VAINAYPPLYLPTQEYSDIRWKWDQSDSNYLAGLHLPFFLWAVAGAAFVGARWRDSEARITYLRLTGETIIYFALIIISGAIMTGITIGLFEAIKLEIADWYFRWIVIYGACSAPIVGVHLALTRTRAGLTIAPLIAKIFSPLAFITLVIYLGAMIVQHRNPYSDRQFLVVFNVMLLSVLAIAVFNICERQPSRFSDAVLLALLLVALIIDSVALSAIVYRLASFGVTPNRTATLIVNLIVFVNLLGILISFAPSALRKIENGSARRWIARFLPIYAVWTAIVVFVLPFIFRFR
jgi:hypothetical protein